MTKHILIHLPVRTRDAGTAHDPKNGQFTAGSNGGSGTVVKHQPSGTTVPHQAPMSGPSGKLPDRQDSKGRGVSSMQNVQARIDAKKTASRAWQGKPPQSFEHEGSKYHHTGKTGTHNTTGSHTAEYEEHDQSGRATGHRAWLRSTGHVDKD